jgi:hypothetical protein
LQLVCEEGKTLEKWKSEAMRGMRVRGSANLELPSLLAKVSAQRRSMTGSAKQSRATSKNLIASSVRSSQ